MDIDTEIKNSVLVVDDNDANIMVLSTILKRMGFDVDEAASGMEAIERTCQRKYHLIFMDHLMPEMDGVEATKQILFLSTGNNRPIIIGVSATIDKEVTDAFSEAGAAAILEKPVTIEKLKAKLHSLGVSVNSGMQDGSDSEKTAIDGILSAVKGLDYKKGLNMMAGSVENYMKILAVCVKNIQENYNSIDLIKGTGQKEGFALHFHSLKGIFLNIGADFLAEKSKEMEMASKEGRMDEVQEALGAYMEEILTFHAALKGAYEQYDAMTKKATPGKEVSESEFAHELSELRQHIEDFEYIEITETLDKMLAAGQGEKKEALDKISLAIQEFDYDEALRLVDELKEKL